MTIAITVLNALLLIMAMALVAYGRYKNAQFLKNIDKVNKEYEKEIEDIRKNWRL